MRSPRPAAKVFVRLHIHRRSRGQKAEAAAGFFVVVFVLIKYPTPQSLAFTRCTAQGSLM